MNAVPQRRKAQIDELLLGGISADRNIIRCFPSVTTEKRYLFPEFVRICRRSALHWLSLKHSAFWKKMVIRWENRTEFGWLVKDCQNFGVALAQFTT